MKFYFVNPDLVDLHTSVQSTAATTEGTTSQEPHTTVVTTTASSETSTQETTLHSDTTSQPTTPQTSTEYETTDQVTTQQTTSQNQTTNLKTTESILETTNQPTNPDLKTTIVVPATLETKTTPGSTATDMNNITRQNTEMPVEQSPDTTTEKPTTSLSLHCSNLTSSCGKASIIFAEGEEYQQIIVEFIAKSLLKQVSIAKAGNSSSTPRELAPLASVLRHSTPEMSEEKQQWLSEPSEAHNAEVIGWTGLVFIGIEALQVLALDFGLCRRQLAMAHRNMKG